MQHSRADRPRLNFIVRGKRIHDSRSEAPEGVWADSGAHENSPKGWSNHLAYAEHFGLVAVKWIDAGLPKWAEASESERGFLDWAFTGWYDPSAFRPLGKQELTGLFWFRGSAISSLRENQL
jgi:hypothetical protein